MGASSSAQESGLGALGHLSTEGERSPTTDANLDMAHRQNRVGGEHAWRLESLAHSSSIPSVGNRHQLEREERNRAGGSDYRNRVEASRYQFGNDYDEVDPSIHRAGYRSYGGRRF